jgi:hypothetical protein
MKKFILLILGLYSVSFLFAQLPDDALRPAWYTPNGSARYTGTGGVMGSLGGDITAANVNPAGLGLFKTNEFVISPGFQLNKNNFSFRGTDTGNKRNAFAYGATGYIFAIPAIRGNGLTSGAVSISINQLASFNNHVQFKGVNNYSSFTEQFLEEFKRDGADTLSALDNYIFGSSLAFRTYLVDTTLVNGKFAYKTLVPLNTPSQIMPGVMQEYDSKTAGGLHELTLGMAANNKDKVYWGLSLNVPIVSYTRTLNYKESDEAHASNTFNYFTFREQTSSFGIGLGVKLGVIYKPKDFWRLGFALHTPQYINFKDRIRSWMTADTEDYAGVVSESSDNLNSGKAGERQYNLLTPWRAIASASYVFREVNDTRKQRAFLSADIEYVNYRGARFMSNDDEDVVEKNYYKVLNGEVKNNYKGNFNFRLGGELKLHTLMLRLGGAYYGSPYAEKSLKANKILATGGLGYRNHGYFIDLGYAHTFAKDVNFPYMLNDKANTYATNNGSKGNIVLTVGFKF